MTRFEITGRKPGIAKEIRSADLPSGPPAKLAFSICEFCALHGISRAHFYNLRKLGLGPKEMACGSRKLISARAAIGSSNRNAHPADPRFLKSKDSKR